MHDFLQQKPDSSPCQNLAGIRIPISLQPADPNSVEDKLYIKVYEDLKEQKFANPKNLYSQMHKLVYALARDQYSGHFVNTDISCQRGQRNNTKRFVHFRFANHIFITLLA